MVGQESSILLSANYEYESGNTQQNFNITKDYCPFDIGILIGAGWDFSNFSFDIRYTIDRIDINQGVSLYSISNNLISFMVGYKFDLSLTSIPALF